MIADRLIERIKATNNPTVVGLDPREDYIPAFIREEALQLYNDPCRAMAEAILLYNRALIDALYDIIPAVKPQMAFYEQYGAPGIDSYIKTVAYARDKGLVVIGDAKRGDISSTAQAYADAHIGRVTAAEQSPAVYDTDFVTVNPYLGFDTLEPFLENAKRYGKGFFILVKTSNPGAGDVQDLDTPGGKVYEVIADRVEAWNRETAGTYGYGLAGAVVGATHPAQAKALRERMPHTFFLVPGYGAQGGTAEDARACFNAGGVGAIVNNSRGIITAYKQPLYASKFTEEQFAQAARKAVLTMRDELGYNYDGIQ